MLCMLVVQMSCMLVVHGAVLGLVHGVMHVWCARLLCMLVVHACCACSLTQSVFNRGLPRYIMLKVMPGCIVTLRPSLLEQQVWPATYLV